MKKNKLSEHYFSPQQILLNVKPIEEYLGLTAFEIDKLMYSPYDEKSPFRLKKVNNDDLDKIPFFLLTEKLLKIIERQKKIKLTNTGRLPVKYCLELYQNRYIKQDIIESGLRKLDQESKVISIGIARIICELALLTKKKNNNISLSYTVVNLLKDIDRQPLFNIIFKTFTTKYLWAYLDGYNSELLGQFAFAFSITMLKTFGSTEHTAGFYASRYGKAFPDFYDEFKDYSFYSIYNQFLDCYTVRVFERFFEWFGFVKKIDKFKFPSFENRYMKTDLIDILFETPNMILF